MMFKLQQKEDSVEIELTRAKRQVDLASRPEVLDYAYNAKLPESTANLSVYDRWFTKPSVDSGGISNYHKVSAAWVGEDGEEQGNPEEWNDLFAKQNDQQYTHQFGVGEAFHSGESLNQYQNTHRRSRVASTGGQGTLLEIPGHLGGGGGGGNNLRNFNVIPKSQLKTTTAHTTTQTTPPPPPSPRPTYKRPQLKSLGTPDKPTTSSTAVQLEAGPGHAGGVHSHWRLARWARRLFQTHKPVTFNQPWTREEQQRLEELLDRYPTEETEMERWKKIAAEMGNRTPVQVQSRVQKYFLKLHRAGLPIPGRLPPQRNKNRYFSPGSKRRVSGAPVLAGRRTTFLT